MGAVSCHSILFSSKNRSWCCPRTSGLTSKWVAFSGASSIKRFLVQLGGERIHNNKKRLGDMYLNIQSLWLLRNRNEIPNKISRLFKMSANRCFTYYEVIRGPFALKTLKPYIAYPCCGTTFAKPPALFCSCLPARPATSNLFGSL